MQDLFEYSPEVKKALLSRKPILALESTLITHGLPFPENKETALLLENVCRELNVIPATIALMKGKIKIGLSANELDELINDKSAGKASRRDLAYLLAIKCNAGTTVAATLFCAYHAGIQVFATGGIGGVHRGDEMDISADLLELSRIPIAVICSGAKAILDIPKTLEYLETNSISITGYKTSVMPAFYSDVTPYQLPARADDIATLVKIFKLNQQLNILSSTLILNPIPKEYAIDSAIIEPVIEKALIKLREQKISGKAVTPFLLSEVAKVTQGKSLQANIALIKNNVMLGAKLCLALYKEKKI